jgi:hypothetical protein
MPPLEDIPTRTRRKTSRSTQAENFRTLWFVNIGNRKIFAEVEATDTLSAVKEKIQSTYEVASYTIRIKIDGKASKDNLTVAEYGLDERSWRPRREAEKETRNLEPGPPKAQAKSPATESHPRARNKESCTRQT